MAIKITPEIREAMLETFRKYGKQGGKTAAKNMTAEERRERAKKAAKVAGENRRAKRLAAQGTKRTTK